MKKNLRSMIESWQESPAQILVDMNQYDLIESTGMKPDLAHKKSAHMSAAWRLRDLNRVVIPMGGSDLSGVRYLTFSVCAVGAVGATFRLVFSNSQTGENIGGYETTVCIAKDGWNDYCLEIPFLHSTGKSTGWNDIGSIIFEALNIPADQVLLGSTGVIGPNLPLDRITAGVTMMKQTLSDNLEAGTAASRAIMTTDTVNKECAVAFELSAANGQGTVKVRMGGMSKGSGMIHPNMCTMLAYITTDCAIDSALLQQAVSDVVADTFNMISVDGDTSTNDTLLVLANGAAGNEPVAAGSAAFAAFREALFTVCRRSSAGSPHSGVTARMQAALKSQI